MQIKNSITFILKCSSWTPPEPLRLSDSNYRASFHTKHIQNIFTQPAEAFLLRVASPWQPAGSATLISLLLISPVSQCKLGSGLHLACVILSESSLAACFTKLEKYGREQLFGESCCVMNTRKVTRTHVKHVAGAARHVIFSAVHCDQMNIIFIIDCCIALHVGGVVPSTHLSIRQYSLVLHYLNIMFLMLGYFISGFMGSVPDCPNLCSPTL